MGNWLDKHPVVEEPGTTAVMEPEPASWLDKHPVVEEPQEAVPARTAQPVRQPAPQPKEKRPDNIRNDGTVKGPGFLGPLDTPDGKVMTEYSIGVEFDGKETEIPTVVPTLSKEEVEHLRTTGEVTDAIRDKAIAHANQRVSAGKSPFF